MPPLDPELLKILVCPDEHAELDLVRDGQALKCRQCRRVYRIEDGIPVMLIEEAGYDAGEEPPAASG